MARTDLKDEHRRFIVEALACFDTPSQVVESVKEEFGVKVSRQMVEAYDPTKNAGRNLSQKWRDHFEATREAFRANQESIPIANKGYRLRALNRMAQKAESMRNYALAAQLHEQAAKECGDAYTNKRDLRHTSPDGSMTPRQVTATMTPREAAEAYEASLGSDN